MKLKVTETEAIAQAFYEYVCKKARGNVGEGKTFRVYRQHGGSPKAQPFGIDIHECRDMFFAWADRNVEVRPPWPRIEKMLVDTDRASFTAFSDFNDIIFNK